jgi:hypothetical protein
MGSGGGGRRRSVNKAPGATNLLQESFEGDLSKEEMNDLLDATGLDDPQVLQFMAELAALAGLPMVSEEELDSPSALEQDDLETEAERDKEEEEDVVVINNQSDSGN